MHRSFKFHAQQSQIGRPKVRARRSKVPRKNRARRIFFRRLLSRDILRRAHGKRHLEMFFHIRPHAALVLTHLFISWLLSLGRSSWKIQNTIFSRGNGGNDTAGSQRAPDQGQRSESQGSYHIDAGHGLTLSISSVGRACQGGCVPSRISRCLDFM